MTRKSKTRKIGSLGPSLKPKAVAREERSTQQKRNKQHKGNKAGNRQQVAAAKPDRQQANPSSESALGNKLGSKKPVVLRLPETQASASAVTPAATKPAVQPKRAPVEDISPTVEALEAALAELEQREDFNLLLDKVDAGESLTAQEQQRFDGYVTEHQRLSEALGLDAFDEEAPVTEKARTPLSEDELWDNFDRGESLLKQFQKDDE